MPLTLICPASSSAKTASGTWQLPSSNAATRRSARVRNVVAQIPGTDPTGRIVLVTHYDSVQGSPGADVTTIA